eukprot:NODE_35_length_36362_cov_0.944434.p31 type:complete len:116 gc:universal NODE_35_length_36362_cov_0.944434:8263-7916(-)
MNIPESDKFLSCFQKGFLFESSGSVSKLSARLSFFALLFQSFLIMASASKIPNIAPHILISWNPKETFSFEVDSYIPNPSPAQQKSDTTSLKTVKRGLKVNKTIKLITKGNKQEI